MGRKNKEERFQERRRGAFGDDTIIYLDPLLTVFDEDFGYSYLHKDYFIDTMTINISWWIGDYYREMVKPLTTGVKDLDGNDYALTFVERGQIQFGKRKMVFPTKKSLNNLHQQVSDWSSYCGRDPMKNKPFLIDELSIRQISTSAVGIWKRITDNNLKSEASKQKWTRNSKKNHELVDSPMKLERIVHPSKKKGSIWVPDMLPKELKSYTKHLEHKVCRLTWQRDIIETPRCEYR